MPMTLSSWAPVGMDWQRRITWHETMASSGSRSLRSICWVTETWGETQPLFARTTCYRRITTSMRIHCAVGKRSRGISTTTSCTVRAVSSTSHNPTATWLRSRAAAMLCALRESMPNSSICAAWRVSHPSLIHMSPGVFQWRHRAPRRCRVGLRARCYGAGRRHH